MNFLCPKFNLQREFPLQVWSSRADMACFHVAAGVSADWEHSTSWQVKGQWGTWLLLVWGVKEQEMKPPVDVPSPALLLWGHAAPGLQRASTIQVLEFRLGDLSSSEDHRILVVHLEVSSLLFCADSSSANSVLRTCCDFSKWESYLLRNSIHCVTLNLQNPNRVFSWAVSKHPDPHGSRSNCRTVQPVVLNLVAFLKCDYKASFASDKKQRFLVIQESSPHTPN